MSRGYAHNFENWILIKCIYQISGKRAELGWPRAPLRAPAPVPGPQLYTEGEPKRCWRKQGCKGSPEKSKRIRRPLCTLAREGSEEGREEASESLCKLQMKARSLGLGWGRGEGPNHPGGGTLRLLPVGRLSKAPSSPREFSKEMSGRKEVINTKKQCN